MFTSSSEIPEVDDLCESLERIVKYLPGDLTVSGRELVRSALECAYGRGCKAAGDAAGVVLSDLGRAIAALEDQS